jgi:FtsJ-like methyltransferase
LQAKHYEAIFLNIYYNKEFLQMEVLLTNSIGIIIEKESIDLRDGFYYLKKNLEYTKSKYDKLPITPKKIKKITSIFDPFKKYKPSLSRQINANNVTNAWLKCYEILCKYNIFYLLGKEIVHFDNASLPGSFILAAHHYANTNYNGKYTWRASSLIDENALQDTYNLYKNYPKNWEMNDHNGDITNINVIKSIIKNNKSKINLYTSDLGFDVSHAYNKQEIFHMKANASQVLIAINILKPNGCCIIKHYTYFETFTQSYLLLFSKLFEKCYIYKPITSKKLNSEVYIVGINYQPTYYKTYLNKHLYNSIKNDTFLSFIRTEHMRSFRDFIYPSTYKIYNTQITHINKTITIIDYIVRNNISTRKFAKYIRLLIKYDTHTAINAFINIIKYIKPIQNERKLIFSVH